jgi:hypothetical protein
MNALFSDLSALLTFHSPETIIDTKELYETICLLDGDLSQLSISMKNVEDVSLGDLLGGEIADEQPRASWELIPPGFIDIFALLF